MRLEQQLRQMSGEHLYLRDDDVGELPPHLLWHAPLVGARATDTLDEVAARMKLAAQLWLRNLDMRFANQLVLSHATEPLSFVAQRAQRPGEVSQLFGPIAFQLVRKGPVTFSAPVRFRESVDMFDRALFAPK
jgi:hypothetical protein